MALREAIQALLKKLWIEVAVEKPSRRQVMHELLSRVHFLEQIQTFLRDRERGRGARCSAHNRLSARFVGGILAILEQLRELLDGRRLEHLAERQLDSVIAPQATEDLRREQ